MLAAAALGPLAPLIAAPMAAALGAGEARINAEENKAGEEDRRRATGLGVIAGLPDVLLPARIQKTLAGPIGEGVTSYLRRTLATGGIEGLTEAAQKVAQNLIAKNVYKPDQEILEGSGEEGAYGAGVGALSQILFDMALGKRAAAPHVKLS